MATARVMIQCALSVTGAVRCGDRKDNRCVPGCVPQVREREARQPATEGEGEQTVVERLAGETVAVARGDGRTGRNQPLEAVLRVAFLRVVARLATLPAFLATFLAAAAFLAAAFVAPAFLRAGALRAGWRRWRRGPAVNSAARSLRSVGSARPGTPSWVRARGTRSSNTVSSRSQVSVARSRAWSTRFSTTSRT